MIKTNKIEFDKELNCYKIYFNTNNDYFLVDICDIDIINDYCWSKDGKGYPMARMRGNNRTIVHAHRLIASRIYGNIDNLEVDHINLNILDLRRRNLRIATHSENNRNKRPRSNTGEKYISYVEKINKYQVCIQINENFIRLFDSKEDAIKCRDEYLKLYSDEFRYNLNIDYKNNPAIIYPFKFINKNQS